MPYTIGNLHIRELLMPVARAGDAIARLDDRIAQSSVREGWIERAHFTDAVRGRYRAWGVL